MIMEIEKLITFTELIFYGPDFSSSYSDTLGVKEVVPQINHELYGGGFSDVEMD